MTRSPWLEPERSLGWADRRRNKDEQRRAAEEHFLSVVAGSIGLTREALEEYRQKDQHFWEILGVAARCYPEKCLNYFEAEVKWVKMLEAQREEVARELASSYLDNVRRVVYSR